MGWGGNGWGNHSPQTARDVAKAFYAGRARKRSNCETNGRTYQLCGSIIARRIPDDEVANEVAKAIEGQTVQRLLEFSFCGWPTEMTCRHLKILGVDACIGQNAGDTLRQIGMAELHRRQVDRHDQGLHAALHPRRKLVDCGADHPFADRQYQATGLRNRYEFGR